MEQNKSIYFSTGEFARLCGIKKDTLFHYDHIGILKPEVTAENGYRYYSINQFFVFDIISMLKKTGTPLKEIKTYMEHQNTSSFLSLLQQKQKEIKKQQDELASMQRLVENLLHRANAALNMTCGIPSVQYCEEEYFITVKLSPKGDLADHERATKIQEHKQYCMKNGIREEFPLGTLVLKEHLLAGNYTEDYYFTKLDHKIKSSRLYHKPAGLYAVICHEGPYQTLDDSYRLLMDFISQNHYTITGNACEHELLNYLAVGNSNQYIIQISIPVCPAGTGHFPVPDTSETV